jgi:protein SCO1/2
MKVNSNQKSIKKILILVTILAVPGFLYYLLQEKGKNRYKPLAIYGEKIVASTFHSVRGKQVPDTIYHQVRDFNLVNQLVEARTWNSYKGKISVVNLFNTQAKGNGLLLANEAVHQFVKIYQKNEMVHFLSITVNPAVDQVEMLKSYAKTNAITSPKWDLLTGDAKEIDSLVKQGLLLDASIVVDDKMTQINFSNLFVLIDSHQRIRGFYDSTNKEAVSKLDDEIKVLIAEELRNMRDGR